MNREKGKGLSTIERLQRERFENRATNGSTWFRPVHEVQVGHVCIRITRDVDAVEPHLAFITDSACGYTTEQFDDLFKALCKAEQWMKAHEPL